MQLDVVADYEQILNRSSSGLRSCKEVLALVKERASIEEAYGSALIKQSRSAAGSLERGTARLGWYAFKSTTESLGRKHLELSSHFAADCTALTYLRDRLTSHHKALVAEGANALKECKASHAALQRARARYSKNARDLDAHVMSTVGPSFSAPPGTPTSRDDHQAFADSATADAAPKPSQAQILLRELQSSSVALNESVRQHQEALRTLCGQLPKLLSEFERVEGQRIDSLKMALKKLLSAQESMLTAQRPLVYAATDMVDAIDRQDDVRQFKQELQCVTRGAEVELMLEEHARQFAHLEQQANLEGLGTPRRANMSAVSRLASGVSSHLREMDRATRVTNDFLSLQTAECFSGGLDLQEAVSGAHLLAFSAQDLALNVEYILPSENRLMRISDTELLLEQETHVRVAPGALSARSADDGFLEAQLGQVTAYLRQLGEEDTTSATTLRVDLLPDDSSPGMVQKTDSGPVKKRKLEFTIGKGSEPSECFLSCTLHVFLAIVSGVLEPSAAYVQSQLHTPTLAALVRVSQLFDRERFAAFTADEACAQKKQQTKLESGDVTPDELAAADAPMTQPDQTERTALDIDEQLVQIAKQQMRRMAEEGNDAASWQATSMGTLMWNALAVVSSEPSRAALWSSLRSLRGVRSAGPQRNSQMNAAGEGDASVRGLEFSEILEVLGGDTDLAQGFAFLPQAFLGCDWTGHVHVTVQHDRGVHSMSLVVSPQAAKVLSGHSSTSPMLTVSSRREVLLDILSGKLEATRAVLTSKVVVSDLSKLLVFKSAFRFKKAYYEAYKSGLRAQQAPRSQPSDIKSRFEASPPDAQLLEDLGALEDTHLREALLFALYSYSGSEWSGDVVFVVGEGPDCITAIFSLGPAGPRIKCSKGRVSHSQAHVVTCDRQVFLDVLTGQFEVTAAIMSGQMQTDDFTAMMGFKRAFKLERTAYQEFCEYRAQGSANTAVPPASAPSKPASSEELDSGKATKAGESPGMPAESSQSQVSPETPTASDEAKYSLTDEQLSQLEGLADDPDLQFAASFLFIAFEQSSMEIRLLCHLSDGEKVRDMTICVTPAGVQMIIGVADVEPTCTVSCSREILMQIIRGELEATNAIVNGMVVVDDIAQIMCFKMAFKLERAAFDAYLASKPT